MSSLNLAKQTLSLLEKMQTIRIGSRASPLALAQAHIVKSCLIHAHSLPEEHIEIVPMTTTGDRITDRKLLEVGGKGLFTKEIEEALLRGDIDLAVHSMKDVATQLPEGLHIPCLLPREDARDVWISPHAQKWQDLPRGAIIGTSSLRRATQVLHQRPDLKIITLRGNIETRLQKINEGAAHGTFLAFAGLKRLGKENVATAILPLEEMLPAVAQGALGLECRQQDTRITELLLSLNHGPTFTCIEAERAFLRALDGSCRTPIAAYATIVDDECYFTGFVATPDGQKCWRETFQCPLPEGVNQAYQLGQRLKDKVYS